MEFFEEKESNRLHRLTEWAVDCAVMIALACYLVFCFGSRVEMNGSSMKPVLESGDVVLMSPASAAFDQFKNFMVRGAFFKKLIKEL